MGTSFWHFFIICRDVILFLILFISLIISLYGIWLLFYCSVLCKISFPELKEWGSAQESCPDFTGIPLLLCLYSGKHGSLHSELSSPVSYAHCLPPHPHQLIWTLPFQLLLSSLCSSISMPLQGPFSWMLHTDLEGSPLKKCPCAHHLYIILRTLKVLTAPEIERLLLPLSSSQNPPGLYFIWSYITGNY